MTRRFLIVGQVMVDVLRPRRTPALRLGGVFHAARGFSAMEQNATIAYIAPTYLDRDIGVQVADLNQIQAAKIGNVEGAPNVILVGEPTEAGDQGYEYLLEKERRIELDVNAFECLLRDNHFTDVLIFPDSDELVPLFRILKKHQIDIHVDANFEGSVSGMRQALGRKFKTLMTSTSSVIFKKHCSCDVDAIKAFALRHSETFLFKENRGGSRLWSTSENVHAPAFVSDICHSVGVGDCFDAVFLALSRKRNEVRLRMASWVAQQYAMTLKSSEFAKKVQPLRTVKDKELMEMKGIALPWEERSAFHIYIAAPDFRGVNVGTIDELEAALKYHNFTPHRPVREHGEVDAGTPPDVRLSTALKDMDLLEKCQALVAVPLFADPGTYIEFGYALKARIPVFVYSPFRTPGNLLAEELPQLVTDNLDCLITEIFDQAQRFLRR